jgi:glycosyltransferase involved in cell wall biosynthesis
VPDPLRIAIVGNGRSIHTQRWARRLAERGHEVHLFTEAPEPVEGVAVHDVLGGRIPGGIGVRKLWRRAHMRRRLADLRPHAVHAHFLFPYGDWAYRTGRQPLLHHAWGSDVLVIARRSPRRRHEAERLLAAARAVTVHSDALRAAVLDLGVPAERIHRIGWGVDLTRFTGRRDRTLVESYGWGDRLVVLSPRLHKPLYNLDVLLRAIPLVHRSVPEAAFLMMAHGPQTGELHRLAAQLGVTDSVRFARFGEPELPAAFAAADLSVSIPSSDGGPASLLEAMASALPLVLSDLPATNELAAHGEGAEVVPLRDVEQTAAAIVRLLQDPELRARYGARNRAVAVERADAARETDRAVELYRRLAREESPDR